MKAKILGVHGVGNFNERATAADRSTAWAKHLRDGLKHHAQACPFDLSVAYYAPALHLQTSQGSSAVAALTAAEQNDIMIWLRELGLPAAVAQGRATQPVRQALTWLATRKHLPQSIVDWFVCRFVREVGTYFAPQYADRRINAREIVGRAIDDQSPQIILAHSLGSVVTYEALWANPSRKVDLLVTLGSPLAMPMVVYDRLLPSTSATACKPPGVGTWVNIADPGDLVAIPRPMSRYFAGIDRDLEPSIHHLDFHRVRHYLSSPALGDVIAATLTPSCD